MSQIRNEIKRMFKTFPVLKHVYPLLYDAKLKVERARRKRTLRDANIPFGYYNRSLAGLDRRKTLVIEISHGGLGDSLLNSHLPRIAKESGKYTTVLLSNVSPFRNAAHRHLVWELNPYLDGFTSEPGVTYHDLAWRRPVSLFDHEKMNFLDAIMLAYGLDDGYRFHEPEVYYRPRVLPEFVGKTIYDPNWVSALDGHVSVEQIEKYLSDIGVKVEMQFRPRQSSWPLRSCSVYVDDKSFEEFCDILYSCDRIFCFATGTAALAASLKKRATVFYLSSLNPVFLFSRQHNYVRL